MIKCKELYKVLMEQGFEFFAGVPDSTFKEWMKFLDDMHGCGLTNRITAIERDAIGWASGYHVATGKIGVAYMQNSGLGNIVNPITSLAAPEVYNIPILLMIGWRGEPGKHDEPQHIKMGQITIPLLDVLGVKYSLLPDNIEEVKKTISSAKEYMLKTKKPYALIIRNGILEEYKKKKKKKTEHTFEMKREDAIKVIVDATGGDDVIISTTGKTSRELYEYREEKKAGHQNDFLMVGSMGCAASFGAEIALQKPNKNVFVFDGDGAVIMSMGVLSTIGYYGPKNLYHIVFDNASHESTGGQPTTSPTIDFKKLALANNYKGAKIVSTKEVLAKAIKELKKGPQMLIVKIAIGSRKDLGRPTTTPKENKNAFIRFLAGKR